MTRWSVVGLASRLDDFVLGPIDLDLPPGRPVAVLGRSGAGKTTLLRSVAGFVPTHAGRLLRDGSDVTDTPPERRAIGFVPQGLGLFPHLSVEENVRYPLDLRRRAGGRARARELLDRFGLRALAPRRPHRLSTGEAQKVALARALAAEPDLLLWDEPAHALDVEARDELVTVFREAGREEGLPLLLVTHDPSLAFALADRFAVLGRGQLLFCGDARELVDRPPDAFAARFAGFENLLAGERLDRLDGELGSWLRSRAGPEGIAFPAPPLDAVGGAWEAVVETVRAGPETTTVEVRVGRVRLRARAPPVAATELPAAGTTVRFTLDPQRLRPLGGPTAREVGRR